MHVPQTDIILRHESEELVHVTLPPGEYVIGRNADVEIFADTPLLSRQHARLTINYDHLLIEDLGSSNGTFINDQPVTGATRLFPNQAIRLGTVKLEIRRQRVPTEPGVSLAPAQATIRRLLPDELLAEKRYAIGSVVAQGGMGAILAAQQSAMKRGVAMKVMLDSAGETDVFRFIEEAQITGQLAHPNIVPVYELGVDENDQLYYTMKMVRGITLKKVLELLEQGIPETVKKYPLPVLLTIFQKVCDASAFAHSKGVIHRDLKPENVMLDDFGVVLVMDWGLAKVIATKDATDADFTRSIIMSTRNGEPEFGITLSGTIMGTPPYMSPEQARGEIETLNAQSDVYALGAILFHILFLRQPYRGSGAMQIVDKVQRGEIEWPKAGEATGKKAPHLPGGRVPDSLVAVVRKAMALDKERRYQRLADLQRDIEAYQNGFATSAENASLGRQLILAFKRHKTVAIAGIIVLLAVLGFGTNAILAGRRAEREAVHAKAEANRANQALGDLRKTAPTFANQARLLRDQGNFREALQNIEGALQLTPESAAYAIQHAEILQALERWDDAIAAFATARERGAQSTYLIENEKLSRQIAAALATKQKVPKDIWMILSGSYLAQKRFSEVLALSTRIDTEMNQIAPVWQQRLNTILGAAAPKIGRGKNGGLALNVIGYPLTSLEPLRGCPLSELWMERTPVTDLSPLNTCAHLQELNIASTHVLDFAPLKGLPLRQLVASNIWKSDLEALRGMPLNHLELDLTADSTTPNLTRLSPLRGMPLTYLNLTRREVDSLEALRGAPLESLYASDTGINDLSPLAKAPLRQLYFSHTQVSDLRPLRGAPLVELVASQTRVTSLEALRGMKLQKLAIDETSVTDLSPLVGMPLFELNAQNIKELRDITSLNGLPLRQLFLAATDVRDLTSLAGCPKLEELTIPRGCDGMDVLRRLPELRRLSYDAVSKPARVMQSAEKFWAEYDAQQAAGKK